MKRKIALSLLLLFAITACVRSVAPISSPVPQEPPQVIASPTPLPLETQAPAEPPTQPVVIASLTPTPEAAPPTATLVPPTEPPPSETSAPTETVAPSETPSDQSSPDVSTFDPRKQYGTATFTDPMTSSSRINWVGESNTMPDTPFIKLELVEDELVVTGKNQFFDTWWFTWPNLDDFFVEMKVTTETCSGKDAYGMILRGPLRGTGFGFGYVVAFSCDGHYLVRRIDNSDPYAAAELLSWKKSDFIRTGSDQENVIGIRALGNDIVVYANGYKLKKVVDTNYLKGRYGVFISPQNTANFTYRVDEIAHWDLE